MSEHGFERIEFSVNDLSPCEATDPDSCSCHWRLDGLVDELKRMREFRDGFLKLRAVLADAKRRGLVGDEPLTWEEIAKALVAKAERS